MDIVIAPSGLPFQFRGRQYRIVRAGIQRGQAYAVTDPPDQCLEAEFVRRIERDAALKVYLADGYTCFADEYPQ